MSPHLRASTKEVNLGWKYLENRTWAETSREERFYCQHLYNRIIDLQQAGTADGFITLLNEILGTKLDPKADWELGYEVCFYRDRCYLLRSLGYEAEQFSPKRTFDLCLFSENTIVVIEAKAAQGFHGGQLKEFAKDRVGLLKLDGVNKVALLGLASSEYQPGPNVIECFDGYLTWLQFNELLGPDPVLERANSIYRKPTPGGANNTGGYMDGASLLAAAQRNERFYVGSKGGLEGTRLRDGIGSGKWKSMEFETNIDETYPSHKNWFSLEEFANRVMPR